MAVVSSHVLTFIFTRLKSRREKEYKLREKSNSCENACFSVELANLRETSSQKHTQPHIYNLHAKELIVWEGF